MSPKIIWKVSPAPTGRFRSFERRGWPDASFENEDPVFMLSCDDDYVPAKVKKGEHGPITVSVVDRRPATIAEHSTWIWRSLKKKATTLEEAKSIAADFLKSNPQFFPQLTAAAPVQDAVEENEADIPQNLGMK